MFFTKINMQYACRLFEFVGSIFYFSFYNYFSTILILSFLVKLTYDERLHSPLKQKPETTNNMHFQCPYPKRIFQFVFFVQISHFKKKSLKFAKYTNTP